MKRWNIFAILGEVLVQLLWLLFGLSLTRESLNLFWMRAKSQSIKIAIKLYLIRHHLIYNALTMLGSLAGYFLSLLWEIDRVPLTLVGGFTGNSIAEYLVGRKKGGDK